jgi:hypothetical protein
MSILRASSIGPAVLGLALLACSGSDDSTGGQIDLQNLNPGNPGADYVPVTDQIEQNELIQEMWGILTSPSGCWDASAAGPVATVSQFTFFGNFEYRHFGFSTFFGNVVLHSVGHYQGRMTAIVETWTGVVEALVILDSSTIAHVFPNPANTALVVTRYGTSSGPCL